MKQLTEKKELFCIEWNEAAIEMFGTQGSGNYGSFELALFPCNMKLGYFGAEDDLIDSECRYDRDAQIEYLGPLNLLVYYNMESIIINEFGDQSIARYSKIENI